MRGGVWDDEEQSFNVFKAFTPTPDELNDQRPHYKNKNPDWSQKLDQTVSPAGPRARALVLQPVTETDD